MTAEEAPPAERHVCRLRLARDGRLGWTLHVDPDDTACRAVFRSIDAALGPHGRRYLVKRVRFEMPPDADAAEATTNPPRGPFPDVSRRLRTRHGVASL